MSGMELILPLIGAGVSAVGTIAAGRQAEQQAEEQQRVANWEAKQLEMKATEEKAIGQRDMLIERRQKNMALSRLQTVAAGSGFSATDPSALAIGDEIEKYGTYKEQLAMYGGTSKERDLNLSAAGRRHEGAMAYDAGQAAKQGSYLTAAGTILGGASTMAERYARRSSPTTYGRYG